MMGEAESRPALTPIGSEKPLISVIIPTCHRNDLLSKCLDRLAPGGQALFFERYEVVVTDDGRAGTAEEMVRERYPWAKWCAGPCRGPAANRNCGSNLARGDWLVFIDDDCLPSFELLSTYASTISNDVYVYEGRTTCIAGLRSALFHAPVNESGGYLWACNFMIEAARFRQLGGFDPNFRWAHMEDIDLKDRIQEQKWAIEFVPQAVVDHPPRRKHDGQTLANMHEADYYYWQVKRGKKLETLRLLWNIVFARLYDVYRHPLGIDSMIAIRELFSEVFTTLKKTRYWLDKYPVRSGSPNGI